MPVWKTWGANPVAAVAARWGVTDDAAAAAIRLVQMARRRGLAVHVTSGYRSPDTQRALQEHLPPGEAESPTTSAHSRRFPATALDFFRDSPDALRRLAALVPVGATGFRRHLVHRGTRWHLHAEV